MRKNRDENENATQHIHDAQAGAVRRSESVGRSVEEASFYGRNSSKKLRFFALKKSACANISAVYMCAHTKWQ